MIGLQKIDKGDYVEYINDKIRYFSLHFLLFYNMYIFQLNKIILLIIITLSKINLRE